MGLAELYANRVKPAAMGSARTRTPAPQTVELVAKPVLRARAAVEVPVTTLQLPRLTAKVAGTHAPLEASPVKVAAVVELAPTSLLTKQIVANVAQRVQQIRPVVVVPASTCKPIDSIVALVVNNAAPSSNAVAEYAPTSKPTPKTAGHVAKPAQLVKVVVGEAAST